MKAYIKAISYYLPERILTNEDLIKDFPEWTVEKVANKIGIERRHISAPDETSLDMAVSAGKQLFLEHNICPDDIDFILLCTQSPDYFLPTSACILQERLKIPISAGALDFNLGCSGFVYGLSLAKGLLLSGNAKSVLLVTSETYSKFLHPKDKVNRTIFGDAATACLISDNGFAEIQEFVFGTDGRGADNLIVKTGGLRTRHPKNNLKFDENLNPLSDDYLFMEGSEIFNFTLEFVPVLVNETLKKNHLELLEIDLFVFHQANRYMMEFLRKKLKIEESKFYYCMKEFGNTVSSTIPIALKEAIKMGKIGKNNRLLLAGFGVGYSWAGCALRVVN